MSNRQLIIFVLFLGSLLAAFTWWNSLKQANLISRLADLPGKELMVRRCTNCHSVAPILARKRNREDWDKTILWMQKMHGMAPLEAEEKAVILDYLGKVSGTEP